MLPYVLVDQAGMGQFRAETVGPKMRDGVQKKNKDGMLQWIIETNFIPHPDPEGRRVKRVLIEVTVTSPNPPAVQEFDYLKFDRLIQRDGEMGDRHWKALSADAVHVVKSASVHVVKDGGDK